jgi:hemerythrin superfamily protein
MARASTDPWWFRRLRAGVFGKLPTPDEEDVMTTKRKRDLIDDIVADHREVAAVLAEIKFSDKPDRELVDYVIAELVCHSVAERQYVYPTARRVLPDGDALADHEIEEHAGTEEVMKEIETTSPKNPRFDDLVGKLIEDFRHHVREEESNLLPKLRGACDAAALTELGEKFNNSRKMAPARPQPSAPDQPPANNNSLLARVSSIGCTTQFPGGPHNRGSAAEYGAAGDR